MCTLEVDEHPVDQVVRGGLPPLPYEPTRLRGAASHYLETLALSLSRPIHLISEPAIRITATPIRPGKEGNWGSYPVELLWRAFVGTLLVPLAPPTIALALGGGLLYKIADLVKGVPYSHIRGAAKTKEEVGPQKLMTLNACMLWGGLPIVLGGMRPPRERMEELASLIKEKDPDILVMQEVDFSSGSDLIEKLKDQYSHFFTRIGPNPPLMESGLFVATKYPVLDCGFIPFEGQLGIYRGAFWIETEKSITLTTHMEAGSSNERKEMRKEQFELIKKKVKEFEAEKKKTVFLFGDLNINRAWDDEAYSELRIAESFYDPYRKKFPKITEDSSTSTNCMDKYIRGKNPPKHPYSMLDYILQRKGSKEAIGSVELVKTYDTSKPYEAISDHRGILLTLDLR